MFERFADSGSWVVLGLMSGTSLDGIDAARVRFTRTGGRLESWELLEYRERCLPDSIRGEFEALARGEARNAETFAGLHVDFARACAEFVLADFHLPGENSLADLAARGSRDQSAIVHGLAKQLSLQLSTEATAVIEQLADEIKDASRSSN